MMLEALDPDKVLVCGDWHRRTAWAVHILEYAARHGIKVVVQVGDFGVHPPNCYTETLETTCDRLGITLVFVDGNHENFEYLYSLPVRDDGMRQISAHVMHLPRGLRWRWKGQTWLALGGAHSVDRSQLTAGVNWWPQESITPTDYERAVAGGRADVMICHDAPNSVDTPMGRAEGYPDVDLYLSAANRRMVGDVVREVQPQILIHGHYHVAYRDVSREGTRVIGLDRDGTTLARSTVMLALPGPKIIDL